ncbi:hypothetical protein A2U01_0004909 [Trifolium medium]|uniref:Uncharacterized protein n=1 Tax=Trifolium medium TaxID=97028 RepID=A0A392MBA5_9FABA|nr:hypothetical protein [Trifolium medium]
MVDEEEASVHKQLERCLPTRSRLSQWHVDCSLLCHICDHDGEDDLYVFFECIAARDIWQAAGLEMVLHNDEYQSESVADRIFAICNKEDNGVTTSTCFCNHEGQFVAVVTIWQQTLLSTVEGQVVALLCAMEETCARGFVQVQFESDFRLLVDAI